MRFGALSIEGIHFSIYFFDKNTVRLVTVIICSASGIISPLVFFHLRGRNSASRDAANYERNG